MAKRDAIRILLADDHDVVRKGLIAILNPEPDMLVIGAAKDGRSAVALYRRYKPGITLMDIRMPEMDGVDATRAILSEFSDARVIVLTSYAGDAEIRRALEAGAASYLLKGESELELKMAIRAVHAGQTFLPGDVRAILARRSPCSELTTRELEVLKLMIEGMSNRDISKALDFTEHTAKMHVKHILGKLAVADRTQAVVTALRRGIYSLN